MAHLLSDLANYFNLEETNIDNWTFKLYYKVSMVICMTGTTVGIASQDFGDPIRYLITAIVIVIVTVCVLGKILCSNSSIFTNIDIVHIERIHILTRC